MSGRRRFAVVLLGLASAFCAQRAHSEERDLMAMADPTLSRSTVRAGVGVDRELPADTWGQAGRMARTTTRVSLGGVPWRSDASEVSLTLSGRVSHLQTGAVFPDGQPLPDQLQEWKGGVVARHLLGDGRVVGVSASLGTWSDHPFSDSGEPVINAGCFARLPARGDDAWLLSLSYSNERTLLNGVPVPGVEYVWNIDPALKAIIGFPLMMLRWQPSPRASAEVLATGFGSFHLGASAAPIATAQLLRMRASIDYGGERYQRSDPLDRRDVISFRALTYTLGCGLRAGPAAGIEATVGYATHRRIVEGHSLSGGGERIDVASGMVMGVSADARF